MLQVFVTEQDLLARLPPFLARCFDVREDQVFVREDVDDQEPPLEADAVNCRCSPMFGDVAWSFFITLTCAEELWPDLDDEKLARRMAQELGINVLYSFETVYCPDVMHLITPDDEHVYTRIPDLEFGDDPGVVVELSAPVPEFPHVPIGHFPDVVNLEKFPCPMTDSVFGPEDDDTKSPLYKLMAGVYCWESLLGRMAANWPPMGWYGADLYEETLRYRDDATEFLPTAPESTRAATRAALDRLDADYRDATIDDNGAALVASGVISIDAMAAKPWYWHRRPAQLPWNPDEAAGHGS